MKKNKNIIFYILTIFISLSPFTVFALNYPNIYTETDNKNIEVNDEFIVQAYLNTENNLVNAIEGSIVFPKDSLKLKEIRDNNSFVNLWIERPNLDKDGNIVFSGIIPGGVKDKKIFLFSMVFIAQKNSNIKIQTDKIRFIQNDKNNTELKSQNTSLIIKIDKNTSDEIVHIKDPEDNYPPEDFKPIIGRSSDIFDNKYFLVFDTQDKGVGIYHYEVREGYWGKYTQAKSPFLLKYQKLDHGIYVKAVDKKQNERVVYLNSQNAPWYIKYIIFVIILLTCYIFFKK